MVATNDDILKKLEEIKQVLLLPYSTKSIEDIKKESTNVFIKEAL